MAMPGDIESGEIEVNSNTSYFGQNLTDFVRNDIRKNPSVALENNE